MASPGGAHPHLSRTPGSSLWDRETLGRRASTWERERLLLLGCLLCLHVPLSASLWLGPGSAGSAGRVRWKGALRMEVGQALLSSLNQEADVRLLVFI